MLIAHISDLHFGGNFNREAFYRAVDEINKLSPDAVIVTGDISHEGLVNEFEEAKKELSKIKCRKLIICSGNHDYRNTGYLLLKKFFPLKQKYEIGNAVIAMLKTAKADRDDGAVGYKQMKWLNKVLSQNKEKIKIVAMHHHVIPIPDTGMEQHIVADAGDLLLAFKKTKPTLVLCGHRHRPWLWKFEDFLILHAGSLSDRRLRGFFRNSYNLIEIDEKGNKSGKIKINLKPVGEAAINFDKLINERIKVF